ncbi:MAG: ABC transporter ATP-binding protein [Gemmatimonadaceae bacterium]|nr:ABC transporter ATP-binding protein [Gemmatimonadaceae bacterium]
MTLVSAGAPAIACVDLRFAYAGGPLVLDVPDFAIARGRTVFLHGPSGCGKTTLLGLLAGVLRATGGRVQVLGSDLATMRGGQRDAFRAAHIGYVFQQFNLIPYLSAFDNIALPCRLDAGRRARLGRTSLDAAVREVAGQLDIAELLDRRATELSVGQQQRVAAARALLGTPELVICDEPTSSLDADRRESFLELLFASVRRTQATLLFVSHDPALASLFDEVRSLPAINRAARREAA